jgi:hypothetical protein
MITITGTDTSVQVEKEISDCLSFITDDSIDVHVDQPVQILYYLQQGDYQKVIYDPYLLLYIDDILPLLEEYISTTYSLADVVMTKFFMYLIKSYEEESLQKIVEHVLGYHPDICTVITSSLKVPQHNVMADVMEALDEVITAINKRGIKLYKYKVDDYNVYSISVKDGYYTYSKDIMTTDMSISYEKSDHCWTYSYMDRKWKSYSETMIFKEADHLVVKKKNEYKYVYEVYDSKGRVKASIIKDDNNISVIEIHDGYFYKYNHPDGDVMKFQDISSSHGHTASFDQDVVAKIIAK